jgi:hypothetical protein
VPFRHQQDVHPFGAQRTGAEARDDGAVDTTREGDDRTPPAKDAGDLVPDCLFDSTAALVGIDR